MLKCWREIIKAAKRKNELMLLKWVRVLIKDLTNIILRGKYYRAGSSINE